MAQARGDLSSRRAKGRADRRLGPSSIGRRLQAPAVATFRRFSAKAVASRPEMAPQGLERIDSAPGNGMAANASNPETRRRAPVFRNSRYFFAVTPKLGESGMSQVSWKGLWLVDFRRRRAANLNQGWDGSPGRSRRVDRLAEAADCGA